MSFSPIIRVRKLLDKMKSERGDSRSSSRSNSPRLKRFLSRTNSEDLGQKPTIITSSSSYNSSSDLSILEHVKKSFVNVELYTGENQFEYLPTEAILLIFSFLDCNDLAAVRLVKKEWISFADDNLIWKNLCKYDWNVDILLGENWKETYCRLHDLFSEGLWEGMSKWIEPAGFDNEQKTTAKLCFQKRKPSNSLKPSSSSNSDTSSDNGSSDTASTSANPSNPPTVNFDNAEFQIVGGGVTVNCATPSPFTIQGERIITNSDSSVCEFKWNKNFEKHTSVYYGKMDFIEGTVSGKISYYDGITRWKGVFFYTKANRSSKFRSTQINA